jgi:hypothetical protein
MGKSRRKGAPLTEAEIRRMVDVTTATAYAEYVDPEDSNFNAEGIVRIVTANVGYFCDPVDDDAGSFGNSIDFELSGKDDAVFYDGALRLYAVVADDSTCHICKRELNDPNDPTTLDCGGDCLRCMSEAGDTSCERDMILITALQHIAEERTEHDCMSDPSHATTTPCKRVAAEALKWLGDKMKEPR